MTDARGKRHVVPGEKIFFLRRATFSGDFSAASPAAAADVFGGNLRRVRGEDDRPLEDVGKFANVAGRGVLLEGVERAER